MCGRFNSNLPIDQLKELYRAKPIGNTAGFVGSHNVAITEPAPVVREAADGNREILLAAFGTSMSSGGKQFPVFNLRSETAINRKDFQTQRCIIPAAGFYEWEKISPKDKQPYYFSPKDDVFSFAGLWSQSSDGVSFSVLTTEPNELVAKVHNRMPVILKPEAINSWLSKASDKESLAELLHPFPANDMQCWQVSKAVNSVKNKDAACINSV